MEAIKTYQDLLNQANQRITWLQQALAETYQKITSLQTESLCWTLQIDGKYLEARMECEEAKCWASILAQSKIMIVTA
jgi:hypothetical protein